MNEQQTSELVKAIINPVVMAAVVTAIVSALTFAGNIVIAIVNNNRLKAIERDKHLSKLEEYRYTKLYALLEEFQENVAFTEKNGMGLEERVMYMSHKRAAFMQIYYRSIPLIEAHIRDELRELVSKDDRLWDLTINSLKDNYIEAQLGISYDKYIDAANAFHVELNRAISRQIEMLTNKM